MRLEYQYVAIVWACRWSKINWGLFCWLPPTLFYRKTKNHFSTKASRADNNATHPHYPRKICLAPKTIIETFSNVIFQTILFQFIFVGSMLFYFEFLFFLCSYAHQATSLWVCFLSLSSFCVCCPFTSFVNDVCVRPFAFGCLQAKSHPSICKEKKNEFYVSKCSSRSNQIRKATALQYKAWRRNAIFIHYNATLCLCLSALT